MSTNELRKVYPRIIPKTSMPDHVAELDSIVISKSIVLKPVRLEFLDDSLVYISAGGNEKLLQYLRMNYEVQEHQENINSSWTKFHTSIEDVTCVFEKYPYNSGIGIYYKTFLETHY